MAGNDVKQLLEEIQGKIAQAISMCGQEEYSEGENDSQDKSQDPGDMNDSDAKDMRKAMLAKRLSKVMG